MFDLFKKGEESDTKDVKSIRDKLLQFIKEQLQKVEGGEGNNIKGMHLFIHCKETEKHMYEAAVYFDDEKRFKDEEVQKIADDFAIDLPASWTMEISFAETVPTEAIKIPGVDAALFIRTRKRTLIKSATAYIRILNGEAEKEEYAITSTSGKVNIGREKKVQTKEGYFRINTIAFPAGASHEANKFISRQHAHIEWNNDTGNFLLFADEGGIPPSNKIKVKSGGIALLKLQTMEFGHQLQEGDQIILGDSAVLEFSYKAEH